MVEGLSATLTFFISLYHGLRSKMKVVSYVEYKEARTNVCASAAMLFHRTGNTKIVK